MRCEDVREDLVAYLDGELSAEERERIDSHLANCPACRAEMVDFQSTDDLLGALHAPTETDRDLAKEVLREAREDPWCRHIRREMVAMLDGELSDREQRPVIERLDGCEACREERDLLAGTGALLDRWTFPPLDTDLRPRVVPRRRRGILRRLAPALAAAGLLLVATIGVLLSSGPRNGSREVVEQAVRHGVGPEILSDPTLLELAEDLEWVEQFDDVVMLAENGD